MIKNAAALTEIRQSWGGARMLRVRVQRSIVGTVAAGPGTAQALADIAHNLPFLHACAVLTDTLAHLRDEGVFPSRTRTLGTLVRASTGALEWLDRPAVDRMVRDRNALAHRGAVLGSAECWEYFDLVERQLTAWAIL